MTSHFTISAYCCLSKYRYVGPTCVVTRKHPRTCMKRNAVRKHRLHPCITVVNFSEGFDFISVDFLLGLQHITNSKTTMLLTCKKSTTIGNLTCVSCVLDYVAFAKTTRCRRDLGRYVTAMHGVRFTIVHGVIGRTFSTVSASITFEVNGIFEISHDR